MPALKVQRRWSRKPKSNPYADRGLDQFALISAELQATRERLVAQLGTPLPFVRFTLASDQSKWIPIIAAPTSSKAEMRALRRAASDLLTAGKHAYGAANFGHHIVPVTGGSFDSQHLGSTIGEYNTHVGFRISEDNIAHDNGTHLGSTISENRMGSSTIDTTSVVGPNPISKHVDQTGTFGYLVAATQGILWMVKITAFSIRLIADIASDAMWSGQHTEGVTVRSLPSSSPKDENAIIDHPSADMASSSQPSSHAPPTSIAQKHIKRVLPPLPPHVEAPKVHTQPKHPKLPSAPCSPKGPRQPAKPFSACVSLPKTVSFRGHTPHYDSKENNQAVKTIPNKVSSTTEKLGQALSGVGVVIVLGGLVMGYVPAIVSVVCWWYVLPRMRNAVGDKPFVRSHYHHSTQEDKSNVTLNNKARGTNVVSSAKDEMQYHEKKKKVIMDGLLERRHHQSHVRCHSHV